MKVAQTEDLYEYGQRVMKESLTTPLLQAVFPLLNEYIFVTNEFAVPRMPNFGIAYWIPGKQPAEAMKVWKNVLVDTWLDAFARPYDHDLPLAGMRRGCLEHSIEKMRLIETNADRPYAPHAQRDDAYELGLNPIAIWPGQGHFIWGNHVWRNGECVRMHPTQANPWQYACPSAFASMLPPEFVRLA